MSESTVLTVHPRDVIGKASTKLAAEGLIPAVLYGMDRDAMSVSVERHSFELLMKHHAAGSILVELLVEGEKQPVNAMIREMQTRPIKGNILHVDFMAVSLDVPVHAVVSLHLVNDAEGVKAGGVLTVDRHDLNVEAKPANLPEFIEADVSGLQIGDSLHVGDIVAPEGVTILDDPEGMVASVTPPTVAVEEPVEGAVTEPEIIGAKSEEA